MEGGLWLRFVRGEVRDYKGTSFLPLGLAFLGLFFFLGGGIYTYQYHSILAVNSSTFLLLFLLCIKTDSLFIYLHYHGCSGLWWNSYCNSVTLVY